MKHCLALSQSQHIMLQSKSYMQNMRVTQHHTKERWGYEQINNFHSITQKLLRKTDCD